MNNQRLMMPVALLFFQFLGELFAEKMPLEDTELQPVYFENFDEIEDGNLPGGFFVLEGNFEVATKDQRKCLLLSANPVGEHGFLFGPRISGEVIELSFACLGGLKSRRHNVFAGAIGGIRGLKFRMNPTTRETLFTSHNDWQKSVPLVWSSSEWIRIMIRTAWNLQKNKTQVNISLFKESDPAQPLLDETVQVEERLPSGKCALWGFSYAEREMYWDDLQIRAKK